MARMDIPSPPRGTRRAGTFLLVLIVVGLVVWLLGSRFYYILARVEEQEVGIKFRGGRIVDVVGPGVYSDVGLFVELKRVSSAAVPFLVADPEIITSDKQRIGLAAAGDIFRPRLESADQLRTLWAQYNTLYLNDQAARAHIEQRAQQAMKVCVGDRTFDDAVIGTARDALRACIDSELNKLAQNVGLVVENVAVPEVTIAPEAQARLDEIVQSRLQTEKAAQDELRAKAQAAAEQALQEGQIRVEQSRLQEETRQKVLLAQLDEERLAAQQKVIQAERANELARVEANRAVIEAQKSNELLEAQLDLEVQTVRALASAEQARASTAVEAALGLLYTANPGLLNFHIARENANALANTEKLLITPEGTTPTLVIPGEQIQPVADVTPPQ
ncbi:MAG: hypothetical protein F4Y80_11985 [Caldilineaceae bacterium SB0665_bin_21]|nr:hypothetical protein [Caldilineaceae bacterium SB0665_bin_21]MYA04565.1 hypothetical protein [Caldilineaceae bacterium SB0664_bin_22]MYC64058.1 hypothetical protein [Caldilineaceae bacterium SB0661_bin_34]